MMNGAAFSTRIFGLSVRSSVPLDGIDVEGPADVVIDFGGVPPRLQGAVSAGVCFQARSDALLLDVPGVARFLVEDGSRVTIERAPHSSDDDLRLFLLTIALGALLHQRGILPMGGSAIVAGEEAILFAGPPSIGKSTVAAGFTRRGYPLLSDGLCAISTSGTGSALVHPGSPVLRLWADSLRALGHDPAPLRRVRHELEKYELPTTTFHTTPAALRHVYLLRETTGSDFQIERIDGFARVRAINRMTWRPAFLGGPSPPAREELRAEPWASHLRRVAAVAEASRVAEVRRPARGFRLEELIELLERDFLTTEWGRQ